MMSVRGLGYTGEMVTLEPESGTTADGAGRASTRRWERRAQTETKSAGEPRAKSQKHDACRFPE